MRRNYGFRGNVSDWTPSSMGKNSPVRKAFVAEKEQAEFRRRVQHMNEQHRRELNTIHRQGLMTVIQQIKSPAAAALFTDRLWRHPEGDELKQLFLDARDYLDGEYHRDQAKVEEAVAKVKANTEESLRILEEQKAKVFAPKRPGVLKRWWRGY